MRFVVWGAGGHGRVVADLVRACGCEVVGFVDADAAKVGTDVSGIPVVMAEADLSELIGSGRPLPEGADAIALGIGDNVVREARLATIPSHRLPTLVHPSAVVSPSAIIGVGSVVLAGSIVNAGARIGSGVIVNTGGIVEHDCILGDGAHVSPGAVLAGGVRVEPRAWIGAGATIIPGVRVGADAVIGAGAAVTRDVPDACTVVGVPARVQAN